MVNCACTISDGFFSMKKRIQNFVTLSNSLRTFRQSKKNVFIVFLGDLEGADTINPQLKQHPEAPQLLGFTLKF